MARNVVEIEREILALGKAERSRLLRTLISELDAPTDDGVEEAWRQVSERRLDEIEAGTAKTYSVQEVVNEARQRLK